MFDVRGQGPGIIKLEMDDRERTTLRPGASKSSKHLARGCLSLPLSFLMHRPSFALVGGVGLRFSELAVRLFQCCLWWPWGCSEEGPPVRNSRCRVDPCNNLKTRTPKAVNRGVQVD